MSFAAIANIIAKANGDCRLTGHQTRGTNCISGTYRTHLSNQSLLCLNARRDRGDYARCHVELILSVFNSMPPCDPIKLGVGSPHLAFLIFVDEKPHWSSPAFAFAVMNCVPSGGFPKINSTDGRSVMPASAANLDWWISSKNLMPCRQYPSLSAIGAFRRDDAVIAGKDRRGQMQTEKLSKSGSGARTCVGSPPAAN